MLSLLLLGVYAGNLAVLRGYILRLMEHLLLRECLQEMPCSNCRTSTSIERLTRFIVRKSAGKECLILGGIGQRKCREIADSKIDSASMSDIQLIYRPVNKIVVREARINWLVNIQHIDIVIPGPFVKRGCHRVLIDYTRPIFA